MKVNFYDGSTVVAQIFAEAESGRVVGRLGKTVELTKAEYDQLLKETDMPAILNIFGLRVIVDGEEVPDPMALALAKIEKDATAKAAPTLIN